MLIDSACLLQRSGKASVALKCMKQNTKVKDEPSDICCLAFEKCDMHEGDGRSKNEVLKDEGIELKKRLKE